ncbi:MAG: hypothetical protein HY744_09950 [Deltaproteobacteria bacterium]|nr:hypothetical protein [Deltaproteobacteria bacterium]
MILLSCVNCCHNPLQSDSLGMQTGYCTEHRRLLLAPEQLTCGRQMRKDLPAASAARQRELHELRFSPAAIMRLTDKSRVPVNGGYTSAQRADLVPLLQDTVARAILDYGKLDKKIASLAQLRFLAGVRPELAMLSLGRAYLNRCVARGGKWDSGVHLLWWTRQRLADEPAVQVGDLRTSSPLPLSRQVELAKWSIVMLRLIFVSDVAGYAKGSGRIGKLAFLAESAAAKTGELSPSRLLRWVRREGVARFDAALPEKRYEQIARDLREKAEAEGSS